MRTSPALPLAALLPLVFVALTTRPGSAQETKTPAPAAASVTVTDAAGRPAAGVRVARGWLYGIDGAGRFRPYRGEVTTDADGRVPAPKVADGFYPAPVFALDATGERGAYGVVPKAGEGARLTLAPLTPVRYKLTLDGWPAKEPAPFLYLNVAPEGAPHGIDLVSAPQGTFRLPPGRYTFSVSSPDVVSREVPFTVTEKGADLGTVALELGPLAKRYGKPAPPLTVTDARGAAPNVSLADYRGKWVLLDFWGFWCPPCVNDSLPKAMKFWDEHAADRDRFAILAFHCLGGVNTVEELKPAMDRLEGKVWNRTLPFPVLLDKTGATLRDWGITVYPYTVLIDPQGNVVRGGSLEALGEKLRQVKATPASVARP